MTLTTANADFELAATGNRRFASAAFRGHPYVIYFYPKDDTPGCTIEAAAFRDVHREFLDAGHMLFGVSRDSIASHEKFKAKMHLPFELLADSDAVACKIFDVLKHKNMYGKKVLGIERSTFVIGRAGQIVHAWRGVKADGHAADVLAVVKTRT